MNCGLKPVKVVAAFCIAVSFGLMISVQSVTAQKIQADSLSFSIRQSAFSDLKIENDGITVIFPKMLVSLDGEIPKIPDLYAQSSVRKQVTLSDSSPVTGAPLKTMSIADRVLRFETIAIGSFPITLLYSGILYSIGRYVFSGFDQSFAPWIQGAGGTDSSGQYATIALAAGFSFFIATVDLLRGQN